MTIHLGVISVSDLCEESVTKPLAQVLIFKVLSRQVSSKDVGLPEELRTFIASVEAHADTLRRMHSMLMRAEVRLGAVAKKLERLPRSMSLWEKAKLVGMGILWLFFCGSMFWLFMSTALFGAYSGVMPLHEVLAYGFASALPCILLLAAFWWFYDLWEGERTKADQRLSLEHELGSVRAQKSDLYAALDAEVAPYYERVRQWFDEGKIVGPNMVFRAQA